MKIEHKIGHQAMVKISLTDRSLIKKAFNKKGSKTKQCRALNVARQQIYIWMEAEKIELKRLLFLQAYLEITIVSKKDLSNYFEILLIESEKFKFEAKLNLLKK